MTEPEIIKAKEKAIEYYSDVPVYKYTAMYVGIDEDTLLRWRQADAVFADNLQEARASWVRKRLKGVAPYFSLERLEKEVFSPPKQEIEVTNGAIDKLVAAYLKKEEENKDTNSQRIEGTEG